MNILDMTISELLPIYLETIKPAGTKRATRCSLLALDRFVENIPLRLITTEHLMKWRVWLATEYKTRRNTHLKEQTQRTYMALAKSFFQWFWGTYRLEAKCPVEDFTASPLYKDKPATDSELAMRPEHFQALYQKAIETEDWLAKVCLSFLEATGCRIEGLIKLEMDNLNLRKRTAVIYNKGSRILTRTGHVRKQYKVAFHNKCAKDLDDYIQLDRGSRWSGYLLKELGGNTSSSSAIIRGRFNKLAALCNLTDYPHNPHSIRHMFAVQRLLAGVSPEFVSQLMGHSSIHVTMQHYGRFVNNNDLASIYDMSQPNYLKNNSESG